MSQAIQDITKEREYQQTKFTDFDKGNSQSDWINFITRYASGAAPRLEKRKDLEFRQAMVKVAALAVAAIEAHDKGLC